MAIDTNEIRARGNWVKDKQAQEDIFDLCDEIDRLRAEAKPTPQQEGKTVKVRVAVCVDKSGDWAASGWKDSEDIESAEDAKLYFNTGPDTEHTIYWLTAVLPIPEEREVEATVEKCNEK